MRLKTIIFGAMGWILMVFLGGTAGLGLAMWIFGAFEWLGFVTAFICGSLAYYEVLRRAPGKPYKHLIASGIISTITVWAIISLFDKAVFRDYTWLLIFGLTLLAVAFTGGLAGGLYRYKYRR